MRNLGLETPLWEKIKSKIEISSTHVLPVGNW